VTPAGRPRSAEADQAILEAALACYADHGFEGLTVDAVAEKAGVGKATIYRRYPSKIDLVFDAVATFTGRDDPVPDTGSLRGDLTELVGRNARVLSGAEMQCVVRNIASDCARYADVAEAHAEYVARKRATLKAVLDAAVARGEVPGYEIDVVIDVLMGPVFFRALFRRRAVDRRFVDTIVDTTVAYLTAGRER
jgi:AcrR family transcriptional regulator